MKNVNMKKDKLNHRLEYQNKMVSIYLYILYNHLKFH